MLQPQEERTNEMKQKVYYYSTSDTCDFARSSQLSTDACNKPKMHRIVGKKSCFKGVTVTSYTKQIISGHFLTAEITTLAVVTGTPKPVWHT